MGKVGKRKKATFRPRGKSTYRVRDLREARKIAQPGDKVEVRPDGTITIVAVAAKADQDTDLELREFGARHEARREGAA
jgi:hypothetical protein